MYKDFVTVAKDQTTQEIKCFSQVFKIEQIKGYEDRLFAGKDDSHVQNGFYVIVDPVNWHATLFYHKWTSYW